MHIPVFRTMRARLVLAILVVQFAMLGVLLTNVDRISSNMVARATEARVAELSRLINAAISPYMEVRDYGQATELLDRIREPQSIDYLVLLDSNGKVLGNIGWDITTPLPKPDPVSDPDRHNLPSILNISIPIEQGGQHLGSLRYGISTDVLLDSTSQLVWQSAWVVSIGAIVSAIALALMGIWLTRRLYHLIEEAERSATGDVPSMIPVQGDDEVGVLTSRFNDMARAVQERFEALSLSEAKFHAIADFTYGVELWINPAGRLVWVNASVTRLTGYSIAECMDMRDFPVPLAAPEERVVVSNMLKDALTGTSGQDFEFRAMRRDGRTFWAQMSWQPIFDPDAEYQGIRASINDSTKLKEDRIALKRAVFESQQSQALAQTYVARAEIERSRLSALLSAMRFGVLFVDRNNNVVFHNPAFKTLWLIDDSHGIVDRPIGQVLQISLNRPANYDISMHLESANTEPGKGDVEILTMNDGRIINQHIYPVRDESGALTGHMWIYEDVTQEHFLNERMIFLAERDALTGLFNRHAFQEQLERMLADAERGHDTLAVLYFDLDEFKYVNDTFGHGAGDDLLKRVAREISSQVRRNEFFARLGGDEFAVLVPGCNETEVSYLANRIVTSIQSIAFMVDQQNLRLSSSLGVALYPMHADTAEELVAHADTAMYQAKAAGKSTWRMYRPEQDDSREIVNRLTWNERIQQALENDGLVLHFQGIYYSSTRELAHLEALIRMKDPANPDTIIAPGQFILHAERSGKIVEIDRWVIARVIKMLSGSPNMPSIALNISGRSFDEASLPEYISELLHTHGVAPHRLMVELTETAAVSDMRDAQRFIEALRSTGCTVCLDDFGAGFSSFAYLKHLKAAVLKIDGLFIRDLPRDKDSQIFVKGMARMARDMGKETVAEFVEDAETLHMLVEMGVDMVQGYFLDKPIANHPALTNPHHRARPDLID